MSKIVSIKESHLFRKAYEKGRRFSEKNVSVYVLKNYKSDQTLLGITTSKKLGNAVRRSRVRRMIREAYRALLRDRAFIRPFLIVVVARGAAYEDGRKTGHVQNDLEKALLRAGVFRGAGE